MTRSLLPLLGALALLVAWSVRGDDDDSAGTLVEILGAANVPSGCKNSSIGLSADGSTIYYLDIRAGRVLVLEKRS